MKSHSCRRSSPQADGRSPCGERGLKLQYDLKPSVAPVSLPVRGAWIEIAVVRGVIAVAEVAPRAGSVD